MPIRLNLLAEAQAADELRRRDPVKRAIWIGVLIAAGVLGWSGILQSKIMTVNHTLGKIEAGFTSQTNQYAKIIDNQRKLVEADQKLASLKQLGTNRFLWGNLLNALQQTTVDDIQLLRLRSEQKYELTLESKAKTNELGKITALAKPASVAEKIVLMLDAKDTSANPGGEQMNKFKDRLATFDFFKNALGKKNEIKLKTFSMPQVDPELGKQAVSFSLEADFPEKVFK